MEHKERKKLLKKPNSEVEEYRNKEQHEILAKLRQFEKDTGLTVMHVGISWTEYNGSSEFRIVPLLRKEVPNDRMNMPVSFLDHIIDFTIRSFMAKVSSKGQVVIPDDMRKLLNIKKGTEVILSLTEVRNKSNIDVMKMLKKIPMGVGGSD